MEQKTDRLHASAPLEKDDLDKRLQKKLNDVNSFKNHINNIKQRIKYFKDKNHKSKKNSKNYKTITTIFQSVDMIVVIGATPTSISLTIIGIGLIISQHQLDLRVSYH